MLQSEAVGAVGGDGVHAVFQVGHLHHGRQRHAHDGRLAEGRSGGARARHHRLLVGIFGQVAHVDGEVLLDVAAHVHVEVGHAALHVDELGGRLRAHAGQRCSEHVEQLVVGGDAFLVEGERSLGVGHGDVGHVVLVEPLCGHDVVSHGMRRGDRVRVGGLR